MVYGILHGGAALVLLTTVLPLIRTGYWWVRLCDFPRLQIACAGVAVLIGYAALGPATPLSWAMIAAVIAALGWQGYLIFRYLPVARVQVHGAGTLDDDRTISFLVANVYMDNRKADGLLDLIDRYDPDVVLAMETDQWWADRLATLKERFPHALEQPQGNTYGMLLYSRHALHEPKIRFVLDQSVPSMTSRIELGDRSFRLYALHPRPPRLGQDTFKRDAELLVVGRQARDDRLPAVVIGDFNDVAWSHTTRLFLRYTGLLDPRVGRGFFATFHAKIWLARWPLDHIFVSPAFRLRRIERLPAWGSDHFPIFVELQLTDDRRGPQAPGPEDRDEARESIAEGAERADATPAPRLTPLADRNP